MKPVPRKNIKLHPHVMVLLEDFKEVIHDHASPKSLRHPDKKPYRMPFSWNDFFTLIIADWNGGRMKCHCGHFYDCPHCRLMIDVNDHLVREKLKSENVFYDKQHHNQIEGEKDIRSM